MAVVVDIETVKIIKDSIAREYKEQIKELVIENKRLSEKVEQLTKQESSGSLVSLKEFEEFKKKFESLTELVSLLRSRPEEEEVQYDLRNEFSDEVLFGKSKLKLDWVSDPITAKTIEAALKRPLDEQKGKKPVSGFDRYNFPPRAIDIELTLREWIIPNKPELWEDEDHIPEIDITKFEVTSSLKVNNSFIPWEPKENQVALGTGAGKSTFFLRCTAHCNPDGGGATLVVPYGSLVGSVLSAHNKWLSQGKDVRKNDETGEIEDDPEKRVTRCPICRKKHTAELDEKGKAIDPYLTKGLKQIKEAGPDCKINVLTWWEFLDVYLNSPELIKPWVVFDEGHTDLPAYRALIAALEKIPRDKRPGRFGIVQMSATFGNRPTSKKLTGNVTDYYVTNFSKFLDPNCKVKVKVKDPKTGKDREEELKSQPDFFKKKVIVFCDDFKEIDFKVLKENNIKYIKLDDSLKDYATDIVRETSAPVLIFANRDYSVGFSFGDVNVISTGVSRRKIIVDEKGTEKIVGDGKDSKDKGKSDFADLLQERGRSARDTKHIAAWVSLIPENGKYVLQGDYWGTTIENYFKTPNDDLKKKVMNVISLAGQEKKPESLPEEAGRLNLHKLLVADLREQLNDPNKKLFNVLPSEKKVEKKEDEKYVRNRGEYIFKSPLVKYFKKEYLPDILISTTEAKVDELAKLGRYPWYETEEQDDDFIFSDIGHVEPFGFYFQARAGCEIVEDKTRDEDKNKELRLKFKTYTIQGKKAKLKLQNKG